jgi:hypothetical protein
MLGFVAISHLCGVLSNRLRLAERYEQLRTPTLWDDHTPLTRAAVAGAGAEVMAILASGPRLRLLGGFALAISTAVAGQVAGSLEQVLQLVF